jgi:hypothetical protein
MLVARAHIGRASAVDCEPCGLAAGPEVSPEKAREARDQHLSSGCAGQLPRRRAQVVHALLEATTQAGGGPVRTSEVMIYDREALTVQATGLALFFAMRHGLADRAGPGLWMPSNAAWEMRRALEHYVLDILEGAS